MVKGQIEERISNLKQNFKQPTGKVLHNVDVKACLSDLHNKYVFAPVDKAPNNIIIICKRYYIETLIKNWDWIIVPLQQETRPTLHVKCRLKTLSIRTILSWSLLVLSCLKRTRDYLYWTPKLHKSPVRHRFIAGSSKCTMKKLSSLLTKILTVIKTGQEKYCSI